VQADDGLRPSGGGGDRAIGVEEVLLARMAPGSVSTSSRRRNRFFLTCSSSTAASMTRSAPLSRDSSPVAVTAASARSRSCAVMAP
jgi:hypothetical protein